MNCNTSKLALATLAVTMMAATLATPAEARRYKHKAPRHTAAFATGSGDHLDAANLFGPMVSMGAMQMPDYGVAGRHRGWRPERGPRLSRSVRPSRAAFPSVASMPSGGFGSGLVDQARRYVGTNPTGMGALWCARFMNMVLEKSGRRGTGSNMASSFAQ
jgi:hypothetical protein